MGSHGFVIACFLCFFAAFCFSGVEGRGRGMREERLTFYVHDIITPTSFSQPTAKAVAGPPGGFQGSRFFGSVVVFDDKVTTNESFASEEIGRARGVFVVDAADQQPISLLNAMTVVFSGGPYNGSSLALFGQDAIASSRRFLPIIAGTSRFYLCRGAARLHTSKLAGALNSVVHFSVHLFCPRRLPPPPP